MDRGHAILNPHPTKLPGPELLHRLVKEHVDEAVAAIDFRTVDGSQRSLSYSEFHARSNRLARRILDARKYQTEQERFVVPVFIPQCPELYISQLGILKAAGAFCPLTIDTPPERIRFILNDVQATVFLATQDMRIHLPPFDNVTVIFVDDDYDSSFDDADPAVVVHGHQPAYVMYTSGSTGQPKGVVLSHSAATQALLAHDRHIPHFARFLQFANPTFDVSVFEIFFPFYRGCTLVGVDRKLLLSDLPGVINSMKVDACELTPSVANSLLRKRASVPSLKVLLTIGEMLKQPVVDEFAGSAEQPAVLYGMYGPTEATIHCTLQPSFMTNMSVRNIGVPLDTVSAFIIKPLPENGITVGDAEIMNVDEEGELAVGGHQLADGYLNRAEQTTAAFITHSQHGRLYRTGDKAKMLANGTIECLGRISSGQVKLRGQRIELGEIEYAASRTEGCRSCVAEVVNGALVVFVEPVDSALEEAAVRETCRTWLPAFMVPGDVLVLPELPYLASGKVDRKGLREMFLDHKSRSNEVAPTNTTRSPLCDKLLHAIRIVLQVDASEDTLLAAAGLDSLSSIRLASELAAQGLPRCDASSILGAKSVRHLESVVGTALTASAAAIKSEQKMADNSNLKEELWNDSSLLPIRERIESVFVATPVQAAMISETSRNPEAYCNWVEIGIGFHCTQMQIQYALENLAAAHSMLRAGFIATRQPRRPYAVVIFKELDADQLRDVKSFEHSFMMASDEDLLQPFRIQVKRNDDTTELLFQLHHAIYDQWSIDIIRRDLAALLTDKSLPSRPSFSEVANYAYAKENTVSAEESLAFWQDHLHDASATNMPCMNGMLQDPQLCRTEWSSLAIDLVDAREKARLYGWSTPSIFQAAIAYLISLYVGSEDVLIGTVFSGRNLPINGIDEIVGPCLATLPFRLNITSAKTWTGLLNLAHDSMRKIQRHVQTPLGQIKKTAGTEASVQLFDTLFVWQESTLKDQECLSQVKEIDSADSSEFNLVIEIAPTAEDVKIRFTYRQNLISPQIPPALCAQLECIISTILSHPGTDVERLTDLFTPLALSISNPEPAPMTSRLDLLNAIEANASRIPSSPAIAFANDLRDSKDDISYMNYHDLNAKAEQLASYLQSRGVRVDDTVCLCMDKSVELYVVILATLKAGAGYMPLLPSTPDSRLRSIFSQSCPKLCLCSTGCLEKVAASTDAPALDVSKLATETCEQAFQPVLRTPDSLAYVIFTSGSTGEPKGVAVTYGNLLSNLVALADVYPAQQGDVLLQQCSQAFDVSVFEIFFSFYTGICVGTASSDELLQDLEHSIRALGVTHLSMTPTVASLLDPKNVPNIRFLVTSGEAMTKSVHKNWADGRLYQGYGPSETTNICTLNPRMSSECTINNLGHPLANTSAFVISSTSPEFTVLPYGAIGELAFGGEQVFRGYLSRAELTTAKIFEHPTYGRIYRSGDLGRMMPDGSILIAGRIDDQVKLRGNRIELGEINATLLKQPNVRNCHSLIIDDDQGDHALISYWEPLEIPGSASGFVLDTAENAKMSKALLEQMESTLPAYMIPTSLIPVRAMPLTSQGKLDRRLLSRAYKEMDPETKARFSSSFADDTTDNEWTPDERHLAEVVAETLQLDPAVIRPSLNLFALNFDSLKAIVLAKAINSKLDRRLTPRAILQNPSIRRLSRRALDKEKTEQSNVNRSVESCFSKDIVNSIRVAHQAAGLEVERILPCTPLQEVMLATTNKSHTKSYCNKTIYRVHGDFRRLRRCWMQVLARHEILRCAFVETTSASHAFAQVVFRKSQAPWDDVEYGPRYNEQVRNQLVEQDGTLSVDPKRPVRFVAFHSDHENFLALCMHHAVYDGISINLLLQEVQDLYMGLEVVKPVPMSPFLSEMLSHDSDEAKAFWTSYLDDFVPSILSPPTHAVTSEVTLQVTLKSSSAQLESTCQRLAASPLSIFQAALTKVLALCQNSKDICFGNVMSGRSVPVADVGRLVAPCFNTLPVRVQIPHVSTNANLIQQLHEHNIATQAFQLSPLRRIQSWAGRTVKRIFDVLLILQPETTELNNDIWTIHQDVGSMDVPIVFEICRKERSYDLLVHVMPSYLSRENADELLKVFNSAVVECVNYPAEPVLIPNARTNQPLDELFRLSEAADNSTDGQSSEGFSDQDDTVDAVRNAFALLAEVNLSKVQPKTTMYSLGLDSLHGAQIAFQLRQQGFDVSAPDVMENPSPAALGAFMKDQNITAPRNPKTSSTSLQAFHHKHHKTAASRLGVSHDELEAVRPCTTVQCGMLAQSLQTSGELYVNHITHTVPGGISPADIRRAWLAVQRKHPILRTCFVELDDVARPFLMAIVPPSNTINRHVVFDDHDAIEIIERSAKSNIVHNMDSSAWICSIWRRNAVVNMTLSIHHALYDAESLQLLLNEFAKALRTHDLGKPSSIDNVLHAQLHIAEESGAQSDQFWKLHLEKSSPTRFPDLAPKVSTAEGLATAEKKCSAKIKNLEQFCASHGCTIQALGQSVWARLLSAYVGEPGVTFGTIFSSRASSEDHHVAFPCISTIPIYCDASQPFLDVLDRMVDFNARVQRHRFTQLAEIQRIAGLSDQRLFDTVFVYQKTTHTNGFDWQLTRETANVDYTASLEMDAQSDGHMLLRLTFNARLLPKEQAEIMLRQFNHVLEEALETVQDPNTSDASLYSIVRAKEPTIPSSATLLHDFVQQSVDKHPTKVALEFVDEITQAGKPVLRSWSYEHLNHMANKVAHLIQSFAVPSGSIIAVSMPKSPEASFAFIGILKAGCSFLALDPELPKARSQFILEDSGARILFVHATAKMSYEIGEALDVVCLSETELERFPCDAVQVGQIEPSSTCYCLYTSGTTGTPKGCEITHENVVQAMLAFQRLFAGHWTSTSRWLQFASYWFDVSVLEQFWSWSVGISVVGAPRDLVLEDLPQFIRTMRITQIDLTPSLARLVQPDDVPSLWGGVFITGGEALKQEIIQAWGSKHTICNGYGPTEATIGVTMNQFIGLDAKPANIGRAFDNVGAYVLEPGTDRPVLRGGVGELCVSGKLVGKGYLNRQELTSSTFPFAERLNERIYRTGDLVRLLHDGSFSFLGRKDTQAKLRGQRLEIGEIDSVILSSHEDIIDVASLVSNHLAGGREMLISFVSVSPRRKDQDLQIVRSEGTDHITQSADQACHAHLPGYMIPTHIIPVSFIPLTVNNKVDSKQLVRLLETLSIQDLQGRKKSYGDETALTDSERKLCQIIGSVLGVQAHELGRNTRVISAGLSSISAISLVRSLKQKGFPGASIVLMMKNPSIGELHEMLTSNPDGDSSDSNEVLQAKLSIRAIEQRYRGEIADRLRVHDSDLEAVAPCTPLQQGLIIDSLRKSEAPYFNVFCLHLKDISPSRWASAFTKIVAGVQILRTKFVQTEEGHLQAVLREPDYPLSEREFKSGNINDLIESERQDWVRQNTADLCQPLRVTLMRDTTDDNLYSAIFVHHALYDGISWELLLDHLALACKDGSYVFSGPQFISALAYGPLKASTNAQDIWRTYMSQMDTTPPLQNQQQISKHEVPMTLNGHVGEQGVLTSVSKTVGVSHQAIVQLCFAVALQQSDVQRNTFGTVVSGRSSGIDDADLVIGPLFNTIPCPILLDGEDNWLAAVRRFHDFNISVIPHQHTSLRDIRKWCGHQGSDPVFDVILVFQQASAFHLEEQCRFWDVVDMPSPPEFPLAFEAELMHDGRLSVNMVAMQSVFDLPALQELMNNFRRALEHLFQKPNDRVCDDFKIIPKANQVSRPSSRNSEGMNGSVTSFNWTPEAVSLREAISQTARITTDDVNEHSTIYALGLDSIDAVKLASRMKKHGLALPVSKVLKAQTIPNMLRELQMTKSDAGQTSVPGSWHALASRLRAVVLQTSVFNGSSIEMVLPATPNQEALLADMYSSGLQRYYNQDLLRLNAGIDLAQLKTAWQTVLDASPILRTSFVEVNDPEIASVYAQVVHKTWPLQIEDLGDYDNLGDLEQMSHHFRRDVLADEGNLPIRLAVAKVQSETCLVLSLAHAQYDGHSIALLHQDVMNAYHHRQVTARPEYHDIVRTCLQATNDPSRAFWRSLLSGATPCHVSSRRHGVSNNIRSTHNIERRLTSSAEEAKLFCQKQGVSVQTLMQVSWAVVLSHLTQRLEVVFGAVLACRDSEHAEQVMFPMMNTVALRLALHGSRSELLIENQQRNNEMLEHQRTPLRIIQNSAADTICRGSSSDPSGLFNTLFTFQRRPQMTDNVDTPLYESVGGQSATEFPVAVEIELVDAAVVARTACDNDIYSHEETASLLEHLDHVIQAIISKPNESTVAFSGNRASLCELPAFDPRSDEVLRTNGTGSTAHSANGAQDDEPSRVAESVRDVFAQVSRLHARDISPSTTIESIGIDSIAAIKVVSLLRQHEGINLSVSDVVKAKTASRLAAVWEKRQTQQESNKQVDSDDVIKRHISHYQLDNKIETCGIKPNDIESVAPATSGQTYMLCMWQKTDGHLFWPTFQYRLTGLLDVELIEKAWTSLQTRHSILRTVFMKTGHAKDPVVQIVMRSATAARAICNDNILNDLTSLVIERDNTEVLLELRIHHALYDAVSLPLMMTDLESLIKGDARTMPSITDRDFIALAVSRENQRLRSDFWMRYLQQASTTCVQQPRIIGAQPKVDIFKPSFLADAVRIEQSARQKGLSIQSLLFAAYAKVYIGVANAGLSRDQGKDDVVLGIYFSNRSHLDNLSDLAFPTLNLLPLLLRAVDSTPLLTLARKVQSDLEEIGTAANASVSLLEIHEWTGIKVDTFVNFLKVPGPSNDMPSLEESQDAVRLESVDEVRLEPRSRVLPPSPAPDMQSALLPSSITDIYQHSLDLELAISDGSLDVGLFCPEQMLSLQSAEAALTQFKGLLVELIA